jgi:hypothetical protein
MHASNEEKDDDIGDSFYEELEQVFDHFRNYHKKICYEISMQRGKIFKKIIGKEIVREPSNDTGVRVLNFAFRQI